MLTELNSGQTCKYKYHGQASTPGKVPMHVLDFQGVNIAVPTIQIYVMGVG